jgi:fatty-acyl-CoA synthase
MLGRPARSEVKATRQAQTMAAAGDENKRSALKAWVRALEQTAPIERQPTRTFPQVIEELAQRHGEQPALSAAQGVVSYRALAAAARGYIHWGLRRGFKAGSVVGLLMENCPQYLAIWLGLTRIGASVALINTNLVGASLAHSIDSAQCAEVIASPGLGPALSTARALLDARPHCWVTGAAPVAGLPNLDEESFAADPGELDPGTFTAPTLADCALYIYTSGTTGLPKAARVSHHRVMQWTHWFAGMMAISPQDRMFNCLPMYHSVGGVVATGATLVGGGTVVIRERFSASSFWPDVRRERCTLFQYIGELCRYLLGAPARPEEQQHALRLACGNGLRADVWTAFQTRFRIPQILEYYAATEGNFSLYNCEGRAGSIGRVPAFLSHRLPIALVKSIDGAPLRDAAGRCVRCPTGEPGEAIGQISAASALSRFEGYSDAAASAQKVLRDVFSPGDTWYRTGDLMRQDAQGFFYFVDRLGDTFRWKGENVSTSEVAAAIASCSGVTDVAVYGVAVPNSDGRAGMAALVVKPGFSLETLRHELALKLPRYARPLFVRLLGALELTGTFKLRKQDLERENYDPRVVRDPLFVEDPASDSYRPLGLQTYQDLQRLGLRGSAPEPPADQ